MDPIANMFTQLKNASAVGKKHTQVKFSKVNLAILQSLKNSGYIADLKEEKDEGKKYPTAIFVTLKYKASNDAPFNDIKRVSKPGSRIYIGANKISRLATGKKDILISTSKGIMGGREARKKGLGGELICEVK